MTHHLNLKPEHDFIFIKHAKVKQTTMASGVIVAQVNKFNDILQGTVVEVGENPPYPLTVSKNDAVWFSEKDVKSTTIFDGKEYLVIREVDILGYSPA